MQKSPALVSEPKGENTEKNRRLYRLIIDGVKRLEEGHNRAQKCLDIFTPVLQATREQLWQHCKNLVLTSPLTHGRKAEDLLWKKGFHEVMSLAKQLRKDAQWSPVEVACLQHHLLAGIKFYHLVLTQLQKEFQHHYGFDFSLSLDRYSLQEGKPPKVVDTEVSVYAYQAVHRTLISLGDLSRYLVDLIPSWSIHQPYRYYLQAINLNPSIGLPYNQIGFLCGLNNHDLDASYYYMRCLRASEPFDLARNNLRRLYTRNAKQLETILAKRSTRGNLSVEDTMECCIRRYLKITELFFWETQSSINIIEQECHFCLLELQECFYLPQSEESNCVQQQVLTPTFMSDDIAFKMAIMILTCVSKLQESGSNLVSLVVAFAMAFFSQIVHHCVVQVQETAHENTSAAENLCAIQQKVETNGWESLNEEICNNNKDDDDNREVKQKKVDNKKTRRRRRQLSNSSDDDSILMSEDEDSVSVSSEQLSETSDYDDQLSSESESGDEKADTTDEPGVPPETKPNGVNKEGLQTMKKKVKKSSKEMMELLLKQGMLSTIKLYSNWLENNRETLKTCARSSATLMQRLVALFNLVSIDDLLKDGNHPDGVRGDFIQELSIYESLKFKESRSYKIPLPEDTLLRGFQMLKAQHRGMEWKQPIGKLLTTREEAILRILHVLNFGHFLTTMAVTGIQYNREKHSFHLSVHNGDTSTVAPLDNSGNVNKESNMEDPATQQHLMQSMAQLWLQAEVKDLETRVHRSHGPPLSAYLVIDDSALSKHLHMVKHLASARRFILIVPNIVVSRLDAVKKTSTSARDSIRWLEFQFQRGNRFVRAQRSHERAQLPLLKYPRRKDQEQWAFFQVLECCLYLSQLRGNNDSSTVSISTTINPKSKTTMVTLLVGDVASLSTDEFSVIGLSQTAGITVESITDFHGKWKNSTKNKG